MGLINHDVFESSNGVQKADSYMSFNNETLYLRKANGAYSVHANYRIFWDKAARDAGKSFLELRNVSAQVSEADLANNLYGVLYAELKKQYPNAVDEQEPAVPVAPVAPAPSSEPAPASSESAPASSESAVPASEPAPAPSSEPVAPSESAVPASEPAPAPSSESAPAPSSESAPASSEPAPAPSQ